MTTQQAWPTELRLQKDRRVLHVSFDSGEAFALDAEYLRVRSPSAEVQGHSPDERKTVGGKRDVAILEVHPVGNYAVRLVFDDLHSTGIFSWDYLFELGRNRERYWREYLDELTGKNLSREPTRRA
ncbi:MAG: DUF971 domain-containing protein [Rhizobiales bacterium]|nr:DUF971 domain-containing protein [Hyphomicrobiales bacterium]